MLVLVLTAAVLCSSSSSSSTVQPPQLPPNVVLMLVDELGTGDVPWSDNEIIAPTIKELGEEGLRLGTSYAWHWCAPTRGGMSCSPPTRCRSHCLSLSLHPLCVCLSLLLSRLPGN